MAFWITASNNAAAAATTNDDDDDEEEEQDDDDDDDSKKMSLSANPYKKTKKGFIWMRIENNFHM